MQFKVDFPDREVTSFMRVVFDDQMPFATAVALNQTALEFQKHQRGHLRDIFKIRRKQFADRSIKIKPFAKKQRPEVTIAVDSPKGRSDIFGKFEDETRKDPFRVAGSIAVPTDDVPRTGAGIIPKKWRPRELLRNGETHGRSGLVTRGGITKFRRKSSSGRTFTGRRAAFLIRDPAEGGGTIFERDGPDLVALYQLVPSVRIEPELEFVDNANEVVQREWERQFVDAFDRATRTAR